jgi:hypothetical protein
MPTVPTLPGVRSRLVDTPRLRQHVLETPDRPFFLFHATQAVHLPSFPGKEFQGKTKSGPHGDFIFEFDHIVPEYKDKLKGKVLGLLNQDEAWILNQVCQS